MYLSNNNNFYICPWCKQRRDIEIWAVPSCPLSTLIYVKTVDHITQSHAFSVTWVCMAVRLIYSARICMHFILWQMRLLHYIISCWEQPRGEGQCQSLQTLLYQTNHGTIVTDNSNYTKFLWLISVAYTDILHRCAGWLPVYYYIFDPS